uniref:Uncharacterized protein n=1 Tax=Tanacetum cinerariifolium TaxID=118510 RepID=A0A6L2P0T6_TANCI|nr:hypothetical protein [Tanacetum cinerariifolium]
MHNNGRDHVVYSLVQRNGKLSHPRLMKRGFWSYSIIMPFTVNLYLDGVFVERPLQYTNGDFKVIDDVNFDGMVYVHMFVIIRRVALVSPTCLYFNSIIDLYCEHNGYDVMEMIEDHITPKEQAVKTLFKCNADDAPRTYKNLKDLKDIIDFKVEGHTDDHTANLGGRFIHVENNPEDEIVDPKFKAKKNILDVAKGKCAAFKGKKPKNKNHGVECSTNSNKAGCSSKPDHT